MSSLGTRPLLRSSSKGGVPRDAAGAALLLVVFAIKGALVPLHLWLPGTYGAASPPVAAQ